MLEIIRVERTFDTESTPVVTEVVLEAHAENIAAEFILEDGTYSTVGAYNIVGNMVISENQ